MYHFFTRDQIATMSADRTIADLNGKKVLVGLQGVQFPATVKADAEGTAVVVFETPGIYFGKEEFEIASHLFNNFTAHALEGLSYKD